MSGEIDDLKDMLRETITEMRILSRDIDSKIEEPDLLKAIDALKTEIYKSMETLKNKLNNLHIKIVAISGGAGLGSGVGINVLMEMANK